MDNRSIGTGWHFIQGRCISTEEMHNKGSLVWPDLIPCVITVACVEVGVVAAQEPIACPGVELTVH